MVGFLVRIRDGPQLCVTSVPSMSQIIVLGLFIAISFLKYFHLS